MENDGGRKRGREQGVGRGERRNGEGGRKRGREHGGERERERWKVGLREAR